VYLHRPDLFVWWGSYMWKRIAALVAIIFVLAAPTAFAGGPTSVILVNPGTGKSAALYNSDADYTTLMEALGPRPPVPDGPDLHGGPGTSAINITWLIHDVQVWRIDHVFMNEDGGPWVETYESFDGTATFDQRGVVHKAANPQTLKALFDNMLGKTKVATPIPVNVSTPPPPTPVVATGLHWGSLVIGLAVGALVVTAFGLVRRAKARQ
jgi:hypothetical protein